MHAKSANHPITINNSSCLKSIMPLLISFTILFNIEYVINTQKYVIAYHISPLISTKGFRNNSSTIFS